MACPKTAFASEMSLMKLFLSQSADLKSHLCLYVFKYAVRRCTTAAIARAQKDFVKL